MSKIVLKIPNNCLRDWKSNEVHAKSQIFFVHILPWSTAKRSRRFANKIKKFVFAALYGYVLISWAQNGLSPVDQETMSCSFNN